MRGEDVLTRWLGERTTRDTDGPSLLGDDAAVLETEAWAVTTDPQIEGVHFPPGTAPEVVARRLLAVNLSDLAAMGARPAYAFLALAAPPRFDHRRFLDAFAAAAHEADVRLAGGDLARQDALSAVATLLGRRPEGGRWLRRRGGRPGHVLGLGGPVGLSALGRLLVERGAELTADGKVVLPRDLELLGSLRALAREAVERHLAPRPQIELGLRLGRSTREGAAIDLSDGLARDLHRLCRASGCGARIEAQRLPAPPGFDELAHQLGATPRDLLLGGGEDYVLLWSLPPTDVHPELGTIIGRLIEGDDVVLAEDGETSTLADSGWDHLED